MHEKKNPQVTKMFLHIRMSDVITGVMFISIAFLLKYDNPIKNQFIRFFYLAVYSLLVSIGLTLITLEMGDVIIAGTSIPALLFIVPIGTLYIVLKIMERSNDAEFLKIIRSIILTFKNYFTEWFDTIKTIYLTIKAIPLLILNFVLGNTKILLNILKKPLDATLSGIESSSKTINNTLNVDIDRIKNQINSIRDKFTTIFIDTAWELVSLGGQICCSILPPPFNNSTKCAKQGTCNISVDKTTKEYEDQELLDDTLPELDEFGIPIIIVEDDEVTVSGPAGSTTVGKDGVSTTTPVGSASVSDKGVTVSGPAGSTTVGPGGFSTSSPVGSFGVSDKGVEVKVGGVDVGKEISNAGKNFISLFS